MATRHAACSCGQLTVEVEGDPVRVLVAGVLHRRDRLAGLAERDDDISRRLRTGLYDVADPYAHAVGHTGGGIPATPYVAWAGCLPEYGSVVVVLTNRLFDDIGGMALPLVEATSAD